MKNRQYLAALAASVAALYAPTAAEAKSVTATVNGVTYTATSSIIGQTSTATIAGGGTAAYLAPTANYRSTVGLLMDYGAGGAFVCSGSLNAKRNSIITAGHCVAEGPGEKLQSVTAYFYDGNAGDPNVYATGATGVTTVNISRVYRNSAYTGEVIDQNDIAVLRLATAAPTYAVGYDLYLGTDLTGLDYNVAGYGTRSNNGGNLGIDAGQRLGTGRLRQGDNRYDFAFGDADFVGDWAGVFGTADVDHVYIADFDNGLVANDTSCLIGGFYGYSSGKYCNLGRGSTEVSTAGGDSGGPQFINGKLASVTSFGLTFGTGFGDIRAGLNNTFGELNGFVPIYLHKDFIAASVPEPSSWAMLIAGFGLTGAAMRRRRAAIA
ncbi:MAG: hypothetical protein CFE37_03000 [Alphaproteobacteria bacterium PA4]|nr:MAG: hypothetical protein CFE37_03000 [Alphaproteobacteria bacterium PA4]